MAGGGYTFSQVPMADIPRSNFNRSHGHKTTFDAGYLVPIFVDEALPGDTFNLHASIFARVATPIAPIMDNLHMELFFFAVPNRLVWSNWQKFCGEQENPGDSIDFTIPQIPAPLGGFATQSLFDYFGLPVKVPGISVNALFARAYNLIYNEWFRDENLVNRVPFNKGDGPDLDTDYVLLKRGKRHDYFTSCLPWPQKGPGVELPVGGVASVLTNNVNPTFYVNSVSRGFTATDSAASFSGGNTGGVPQPVTFGPETGLIADLSTATGVTINAMREAFQIQRLLERDARGGTRYIEILKSHFGVTSPDSRLQRPEFLGGGHIAVNINPVTQTSGTPADLAAGYAKTPQGNLSAFGVAAGTNGFTKSFVEHCVILGLAMVRADLSYQQGTPKMFSRKTRYDYYWPAFAHLGEQAVLNREIYTQNDSVLDPATNKPMNDSVFGYQERWAEYRYFPSKITGKFRRTATVDANSLDVWHLAQFFETVPALNAAFITEDPPVARVIAVQTEPHFLFDSHFSLSCTRPMPTYSVPGLIDHF